MLLTMAPLFAALAAAPSAEKARSEIPTKYTWNLSALYPSDAAWTAARDELKGRIAGLKKLQGTLGASPEALFKGMDAIWSTQLALERLYVYASSRSDEDTRDARPRELKGSAQQLAVEFGASVAWLDPELLALGEPTLSAYQAKEPRLAPWKFYFSDLVRRRPHTLTPQEELLVAQASDLAGAGQSTYGLLSNADLPYPTVTLSTGDVRLDASAYTLYRAAPLKEDREKVFTAFFGALKQYERTFGSTLEAQLKAHLFTKKVRKFSSTLEAALFTSAVPPSVYRQLVADVRKSLPTLHRYLELRRKMLGLKKLQYSDIYVPLVAKVDLSFTPEEAQALTLEAVAPLGKAYQDALRTGFASRWTDFLPSTGKRSGAYSSGVWGVQPIQLLNFNGKYEDLSTLAHEAGHSMHTFLANGAQPYPTSGYPTFVAEIASTLNENLLLHHMLDTRAKDDDTRLAILGNYLDGMRGTLFRQTQFAEFELAIHELAERDEPITGEALSALYLKNVRDYYGHEKGVCEVPDSIAVEWAYIPHFYLNFYVFQYATSLTIATAFAQAIRAPKGGAAARERYLGLLKAGGSAYPVDLVKAAGVDPTTSAPFDAAVKEMNQVMDEMEAILAKKKKT